MSGLYTNGLVNLLQFLGGEATAFDIPTAAGAAPLQGSANIAALAQAISFFNNSLSKTMVAGTVYFSGPYTIGVAIGGDDVITPSQPVTLTGVNIHVGGTGGTDNWGVGLYSATGVLLASSNNSGVTAGTANTWQQIPFYSGSANTPYVAAPGTYYIGLQSNGTTATFASINAPTYPVFSGTKTGSFFNTTAIFTTAPTTYTANVAPGSFLY